MKKRFNNQSQTVESLIGLGNHSSRKNYHSELVTKIDELEREKNRYKWLFENALHGIFQAKLDEGIISANPAMVKLCGYDSEEQFLQRITQLDSLLFCCADAYSDFRYQLAQYGRVFNFETLFLKEDGQCLHVSVSALSKDPDGNGPIIEGFVKDITERKKSQDRLKQLNVELEVRVANRTKELLSLNDKLVQEISEREQIQKELKIAKDLAEDANKSKDKYLAAASHDLLQPMNAARLLIAALRERSLQTQDAHLVERVHLALENAEDLLTDLLDISKLDQNAVQPDISDFRINQLLLSMVNEFETIAENKNIRLKLAECSAAVTSDSRLLLRIIRNFISNAIRYTNEGSVLVGCRRKGRMLSIQVWDTGLGIPEEKQQLVFKEFQQLENKSAKDRQGVGLGLAIVERIAHMLGHRLVVKSVPDKGSMFAVEVPLVEQLPLEVAVQQFNQFGSDQLSNLVVLVIDNEENIQASMEALLTQWGCFVITASSLSEALEKCTDEYIVPELILADYHLDFDLLGTDAIDGLREHFGLDIPAVILTADRSSECRQLFENKGLSLINKPVKPGKLRALITHLVC
ncbi:NahK/ErcS family hybrid sensor histidine kinase/response regulator [Neptuniibacter sp. QD48_55]|uniref:PAS domain-containing hybrid sensor histidine kinase/response regulator n=1 Tax=Neptuniibacter sp. QD48_55 TaxID=3398212 RepID=UPI0039F5F612